MREIVHLQVGQAGNQIGQDFWKILSQEHGISSDGIFNSSEDFTDEQKHIKSTLAEVYFEETEKERYVPRSVLVDLEPSVIDRILASEWGHLYNPTSIIKGSGGAANNWAKGHYTEGIDIANLAIEATRKEVEQCDCIQGFQMVHSLGGGTGSGAGTLIMSKIREEFPDRIMVSYPVLPSAMVSDVIVEPYNALLSLHQLVEIADEVMTIDNEALYKIANRLDKGAASGKHSTFESLNHIVSTAMGGVTSSLRFPGQLNCDLRKLGVNLIPFPRLHFFQIGYAPIASPEKTKYRKMTMKDLSTAMMDPGNMLADCDPAQGTTLTAAAQFRGKVSCAEAEMCMYKLQSKYSDYFCDWIPNNIKSSVCDEPPLGLDVSATFIMNTTSIHRVFQRLSNQFGSMFRRKAFVHWYTSEGMDLMEFTDAEYNINDLISEYMTHEAFPEEEEEEEEGYTEEEEEEEDEGEIVEAESTEEEEELEEGYIAMQQPDQGDLEPYITDEGDAYLNELEAEAEQMEALAAGDEEAEVALEALEADTEKFFEAAPEGAEGSDDADELPTGGAEAEAAAADTKEGGAPGVKEGGPVESGSAAAALQEAEQQLPLNGEVDASDVPAVGDMIKHLERQMSPPKQ